MLCGEGKLCYYPVGTLSAVSSYDNMPCPPDLIKKSKKAILDNMHKFQFTAFYLLGPGFAIASVLCYVEATATNFCRWVLGTKAKS